jgi:hypothetical protein
LHIHARKEQQIVDQQAHPAGFAFDPRQQHGHIAGGALAVQLSEPANGGQRGAQFVAGVGDEPSHPFLRATSPVGRMLRGRHRLLDLAEHAVERQRKSAHLGTGIAFRNPAIQLARGDRRGGFLDLGQRPQAALHHREADDPDHHQHPHPDADLQQDQRPDRVLDVGQIDGDGGQAAVRSVHRDRAPLDVAVHRGQRRGIGAHVVVGGQCRFGVAVVDSGKRATVRIDAAHIELRRGPAGIGAIRGLASRGLCPGAGCVEQGRVDPADQALPQDRGDRDARDRQTARDQDQGGRDQAHPEWQSAPTMFGHVRNPRLADAYRGSRST